jgi:ERCC4-related helicase
MTGGVQKALRQEYYSERRVFFTTPQTLQNDLKNGLCDAKRIVCLVVDEAHRTTGAYAYGEVVKLIRRENNSFRILALTATPGSTVEAVQGVIDALGISRIEIRTDESLDIRNYIQKRHLEVQTFPLSGEIEELRDLYAKCLEPQLKKLNQAKAFYQTRPEALTPFALISGMQAWSRSPPALAMNRGYFFSLMKCFKNLASLSHALVLLSTHGIRIFYDKLQNARDDAEEGEINKTAIGSIQKEKDFPALLSRCREIIDDPTFTGHPKVDYMVTSILRHFAEAEDEETKRETRIMVFTSFRDSAEEVVRLLSRHQPMIRPHIFVGQAASKSGNGMSQKEQLEIIKQFSSGKYNTIVSTSIGEEGLDIGEVDLIVCYDTSASPIRLLQRMGRTGRKRVGAVLILLTEGREEEAYKKALDNYSVMQKKIASATDFIFPHELSPRILPKDIDPQPDKKVIEIPPENTQPQPTKRARTNKSAPIKKFFMPEGVETGFTKASRLNKRTETALSTDSDSEPEEIKTKRRRLDTELSSLAPYIDPTTDVGLLTEPQEKALERDYKQISMFGTDTVIVEEPAVDKFPEIQRTLTATHYVSHGQLTKRWVKMLGRMHGMTEEKVARMKANFDPELLEAPKRKTTTTMAFKAVRPTGSVAAGLAERKNTAAAKPVGKTAPRTTAASAVRKPAAKPSARYTKPAAPAALSPYSSDVEILPPAQVITPGGIIITKTKGTGRKDFRERDGITEPKKPRKTAATAKRAVLSSDPLGDDDDMADFLDDAAEESSGVESDRMEVIDEEGNSDDSLAHPFDLINASAKKAAEKKKAADKRKEAAEKREADKAARAAKAKEAMKGGMFKRPRLDDGLSDDEGRTTTKKPRATKASTAAKKKVERVELDDDELMLDDSDLEPGLSTKNPTPKSKAVPKPRSTTATKVTKAKAPEKPRALTKPRTNTAEKPVETFKSAETITLSDDDDDDADMALKPPSKSPLKTAASAVRRGSIDDELPDGRDVLGGFKWAGGGGKKMGRRGL